MANVHSRESGLRNAMTCDGTSWACIPSSTPRSPAPPLEAPRRSGSGALPASATPEAAPTSQRWCSLGASASAAPRRGPRPLPPPPAPARADQTIDKVERASLEALSTFPETFACLPHPNLPPPLGKGYSRPLHGESQRGGVSAKVVQGLVPGHTPDGNQCPTAAVDHFPTSLGLGRRYRSGSAGVVIAMVA